jgi:hypothetical protein
MPNNVQTLINAFDGIENQLEALHFETRNIEELNPCRTL